MLKDNIDALIKEAMKEHNEMRTKTLRLIKTAFQNAETAKGAKPITTDAQEIQILQKMVKQRKESVKQYESANRLDLAAGENAEISIISEFLPEEVKPEQIEAEVLNCGIELVKSNMSSIIRIIKGKYPAADGKLVSQIVSNYLIS